MVWTEMVTVSDVNSAVELSAAVNLVFAEILHKFAAFPFATTANRICALNVCQLRNLNATSVPPLALAILLQPCRSPCSYSFEARTN